jgi:succinate dehydrogenase/fumarate reductase cytochrome b subunit
MSTLLSLPSCLHRTTAFVILALAIFMIAAHTGITAIAAQKTSRQGIRGLVALIPLVMALIALFTSKNLVAEKSGRFQIGQCQINKKFSWLPLLSR